MTTRMTEVSMTIAAEVSVTFSITAPRFRLTTADEISVDKLADGDGLNRTLNTEFDRNSTIGPGPLDIGRANRLPLRPWPVTFARVVHCPRLGVKFWTLTY